MSAQAPLAWPGIVRLGLVQAMLGAVVVLTTSTLNRVMVVELALPALLPGLLVALHYAVQLTRPRMGFGSDLGRRRTPWIIGGMGVLALGGFGGAAATAFMATHPWAGIVLAVVSFAMVGLGVSAAGTSLLVLLAKRVDDVRRASAATVVWVMMIVGFAVTAGLAGHWLDPYSPQRLMLVSAIVSTVAVGVTSLALLGLEGAAPFAVATTGHLAARPVFRAALSQVWLDSDARRFTVFVFVSMLAYSMQDLILEPFAGAHFGFSPGQSTQLSGVQHGGTLVGMLLAALAGRRVAGVGLGSLRAWMIGGCLASALALFGLVMAGASAPHWPLRTNVFLLGLANGAFSIAAIGAMMGLASNGRDGREGTRMGLWGAAQAIGFALGGLLGAAASDLVRWVFGHPGLAYTSVFMAESLMFLVAAWLAAGIASAPDAEARPREAAPGRGARKTPDAPIGVTG